jgi:predicted nucleic acid-binding protein
LIFVDTSALYALADRADQNHDEARLRFSAVLKTAEALLTHNYVLVESIALIQNRIGVAAALDLARTADNFEIEWVDAKLHQEAIRALARSPKRRISLVDQVSFLVMRVRGVKTALAFDRDFEREGFRNYSVQERE